MSNNLFNLLGVEQKGANSAISYSKKLDIALERLKYYNSNNILPSGKDMEKFSSFGFSQDLIRIAMGHFSSELIKAIQLNSTPILEELIDTSGEGRKLKEPEFQTRFGKLYRMDCLEFLKGVKSDSVDLVFADPPFNLNKKYPSGVDDSLVEEEYLSWCKEWLLECARILRYGGSLLLWNLPKWNLSLTNHLNSVLTFRHNIAVDIKYSLPIQGRLYPSNYSLLYYSKGNKPKTFNPDRLPMSTCPHCYGDLKDYGGYKSKMNPVGVSMTDVWTDISPVRHKKYKKREGANELPLKLMDRIIQLSTVEGDIILDPFGGSGTTYLTAELKKRKWIGCEIGPLDDIKERFENISEDAAYLEAIRSKINALFTEDVRKERERRSLWTCESVRAKDKNELDLFS